MSNTSDIVFRIKNSISSGDIRSAIMNLQLVISRCEGIANKDMYNSLVLLSNQLNDVLQKDALSISYDRVAKNKAIFGLLYILDEIPTDVLLDIDIYANPPNDQKFFVHNKTKYRNKLIIYLSSATVVLFAGIFFFGLTTGIIVMLFIAAIWGLSFEGD